MKLSIITPSLNSEPLLERTIESVLGQDFDEYEYLIIDGGSTDGTLELIKQHGRVKLISEPDEGIYDAMNKGIDAASGDWIYFLGAGDYLADDQVLRDLEPQFSSKIDVLYGDVFNARMGLPYDGSFDATKIRRKNICHQSIFCRRRVFDTVGKFNTLYRSFADWEHNFRWFFNDAIRKEYVNRIIAVYPSHGFSYMNPDALFRRDRLYLYLSYARAKLPLHMFIAILGKEFLLAFRHLDMERTKRSFLLMLGKSDLNLKNSGT